MKIIISALISPKEVLLRQPIIRSVFAAMLMVIFACSITPRKTIHDLVASHKDSRKTISLHGSEIGIAGINCKCDNLVAESPFIAEEFFISANPDTYYPTAFTSIKLQVLTTFHFFSSLRGPPIMA